MLPKIIGVEGHFLVIAPGCDQGKAECQSASALQAQEAEDLALVGNYAADPIERRTGGAKQFSHQGGIHGDDLGDIV